MKIIKKSITKDKRTGSIFETFDKIISRLPYPWKLESLEFLIADKNFVFVKDRKATIGINYNDNIIQDNDTKAITSMILHSLYHIIIRDKYELPQLPHFIEDIIANREMIDDGFEDFVFYTSYLFLLGKNHAKNIDDYLRINIPWLSFYGLDNYNSEFLKNMLFRVKNREKYREMAKKLFDIVKRDIKEEKNLNYAINAYEVMLCR